jgi:hypothetical protein
VAEWPEQQERPEIPHLPHEELSLRVTVDSGASGTYTNSSSRTYINSSAQVAWLPNELGNKLIVIPVENVLDESFFLRTPLNPKLNLRPQTKAVTPVSKRLTARARSGC